MNTRQRMVCIFRMSLIGTALFACQFLTGQQVPRGRTELLNLSVENQNIFWRDFGPLLKASGKVGRVYIHSDCAGDSEELFFPRIELQPGPKGDSDINALREMFANVKDVTIAERQSGVVGIWMGNVSNDLLSARIEALKLKPLERYNELVAIKAIFSAREIERKMRQLRIDPAPMFVVHSIQDPDPKLPHLPVSLKNLTVDEALDRIAQTFGGVVIYEECAGARKRLFSVHMREM